MLWIRGGLGVFDFLSKLICVTIPKHFIRELFCAVSQKNSGSEKVSGRDGAGEYQDFPSKFFCLKVTKVFVREPFCAVFQKYSGSEKVFGKEARGECQDFLRTILCLSVPQKFVGEYFSVSLNSGIEKC